METYVIWRLTITETFSRSLQAETLWEDRDKRNTIAA